MDITVTAPAASTFNRDLHRLDADGQYEFRTPDFETEYGVPDPKRYVLQFNGYSDVFQEPNQWEEGAIQDKVVVEFRVVGSKKWLGTCMAMAMALPKDWTDSRGKLHQLFSAMQGRPVADGDTLSFKGSLGKTFEGVVENKVSQKGRDYAVVTTFLAIDQEADDDAIPVKSNGKTATATADDDEFPTN